MPVEPAPTPAPAPEALDAGLVAQTVAPGSMRYHALLYAPQDRRDVLVALHLVEDELSTTVRTTHHDVAHTRLNWWHQEFERLADRRPAHPATRALLAASPVVPELRLHGLLEAAAMDLARVTFADEAELAAYFDRAGRPTAELAARWLLGPQAPPATVSVAGELGVLGKRIEALRELRTHVGAGRVHVPLELLDRTALGIDDLRASPWPPGVRALLADACATLTATLDSTAGRVPPADRAALRPLLVTAALQRRLLQRIAQQASAGGSSWPELRPLEKVFVAWRAARSAR